MCNTVSYPMQYEHRRKSTGRPPVKRLEIVEAIRSSIVSGELMPNHQLPTRRKIGDRFSASLVTVQQALDRLLDDGFVESHGRRGTFVAPNPPHISHYALVFPHAPSGDMWSHFATALNNEACHISAARDVKIIPYYNVGEHKADGTSLRLLGDMQVHHLAGLIFTTPPHPALAGSPILEMPGIARVAVSTPDHPCAPRHVVNLDYLAFADKALDALAAAGCTKIATLRAFEMPQEFNDYLDAGLARRGMKSPPYWQLGIFQESLKVTWAKNLTHLLMRPGQTDRPDGLFILDDNLDRKSVG